MHFPCQLSSLLSAAVFFSLTSAQATTTIVNFAALPSCASLCGPLFDAQGGCTPPVTPAVNLACFCSYPTLQSFFTESNGVCPNACAADTNGPQELVEIQSWFTSFCASATGTSTSSSATATSSTDSSSNTSNNSSHSDSPGATWLHAHWKWVVMLIILFLGITTIWIGAAWFRRRIHRKREREIEMRPPVALGPHQLQSMTGGLGYTNGIIDPLPNVGGQVVNAEKVKVNAAAQQVYSGGGGDGLGFGAGDEKKKEKKRWIVKQRT